MESKHCHDCCCARCWKALGINEFTGKSIDEHISEQRAALIKARDALERGQWLINSFDEVEPRRMGRDGDTVDEIKNDVAEALSSINAVLGEEV